ncbi:uncharacterized protein LOC100898074 [Galendromus occidentalis]|uniref:Uncharacterized protein LOC100898074 n=1 Tax=Galendromus occidentalis TaxID=34638 RepID=A0AAJ6VY19_9ACAR|nr:uncharacterized protein LOC100898074 [Galendromus occidentalis]
MSFSGKALPILRSFLAEEILRQRGFVVPRRFAGHAHWQNVRHIKAANDAHKSTTTNRFVRVIEAAVVTGGGPDPRFNPTLAKAIEQAKRTQVITKAVIETAIKRASDPSTRKNTQSVIFEFFGEHGVLAVADAEISNISKIRHDFKQVCKKHTFAIAKGGVKERFEEKGYVIVDGKHDGSPIDSDELLSAGIEGGAEDMQEIIDKETKIFEFTCAAGTHFALTKVLQETYSMSDMGRKWVPMIPLELSEEQAEKVGKFCDALEELPEVNSVYTNLA